MTIMLYDLAGDDGRRFSPYCWRTRMALAHKGLDHRTAPVHFAQIAGICGGGHKTVPVLEDGDKVLDGSFQIAAYLEETYPEATSLFGGPAGLALSRFVENWAAASLHGGLFPIIVEDVHAQLDEGDKPYFRESREARFGKTLEQLTEEREPALERFTSAIHPLRMTVRGQPFLGGEHPAYADYIAFGAFQWARTMSPFRVLETVDPIWAWFERCRDLHGGLAREAPGFY